MRSSLYDFIRDVFHFNRPEIKKNMLNWLDDERRLNFHISVDGMSAIVHISRKFE